MDNKDKIIETLMKYAQRNSVLGTEFNKKASVTEVGNWTEAEKDKLFTAIFNGPNGLQRVAYAMQAPLKELLDYQGIGRRLLKVDPIPQGEIPVYDKDIAEFASVRVANLGEPPLVETSVKRVMFNTVNLARKARVSYEDIEVRRYPVFDRAKERIAISMAIAEDTEVFKLLEVASSVGPNPPIAVGPTINRAALAQGYSTIASKQLQPASVVMSPKKYGDIIALNSVELDQVTLNMTTSTGQIGVMLGMNLLISTKLPNPDKVYVTTTPDKLGRIPLRKELQVYIFNNVPMAAYDVIGWELIGFGIHNTYGVVALVNQ